MTGKFFDMMHKEVMKMKHEETLNKLISIRYLKLTTMLYKTIDIKQKVVGTRYHTTNYEHKQTFLFV